jgi:hypothetical protein
MWGGGVGKGSGRRLEDYFGCRIDPPGNGGQRAMTGRGLEFLQLDAS